MDENFATFEKADYSAIIAKDARFDPRAYDFVVETMMKLVDDSDGKVASGMKIDDFLEEFRDLAFDSFGSMAYAVFEYWGVKSCMDVAAIIHNLYDAKLIKSLPEGDENEYWDYYDFKSEFLDPYDPENDF